MSLLASYGAHHCATIARLRRAAAARAASENSRRNTISKASMATGKAAKGRQTAAAAAWRALIARRRQNNRRRRRRKMAKISIIKERWRSVSIRGLFEQKRKCIKIAGGIRRGSNESEGGSVKMTSGLKSENPSAALVNINSKKRCWRRRLSSKATAEEARKNGGIGGASCWAARK
jgi:hypothetical protein